MREKFTTSFVETAPIGEHYDALTPGFTLRVSPKSARSWCLLYRHQGKRRRLTIGSTVKFTITAAREVAREALKAIALGKDPEAEKQVRETETFADIVRLYFERTNKKSAAVERRRLDVDVLPRWGRKPIGQITSLDVVNLQDAILGRGSPVMANRVRSAIRISLGPDW
jgi:hypothetical protein